MLPTFLGIGVPRAGTTWLHQLLSTHPEVYLPLQRKEVHFFDEYYDRGLPWYETFFPTGAEAQRYRAVGEITPAYIYHRRCLEQIANMPSVTRLILILRNPIERAYSYYGLKVRNANYSGSLEDFLSEQPGVLNRGFYSHYLETCYQYFNKEQVLVLITEQAVTDVQGTKETLARFLDIAVAGFPVSAGTQRVNQGYVTKTPMAYSLIVKASRRLKRWDRFIDLAKKLGIKRFFSEGEPLLPMTIETRHRLESLYADEVKTLESLLGIDLTCWK